MTPTQHTRKALLGQHSNDEAGATRRDWDEPVILFALNEDEAKFVRWALRTARHEGNAAGRITERLERHMAREGWR